MIQKRRNRSKGGCARTLGRRKVAQGRRGEEGKFCRRNSFSNTIVKKKKLTGMNFSHGGRLAQPVWPDGAIRCGLLFPLHALFLPRNVLGIFFWSRVMLNFKFYCRFSLTLKGLKREIIN